MSETEIDSFRFLLFFFLPLASLSNQLQLNIRFANVNANTSFNSIESQQYI